MALFGSIPTIKAQAQPTPAFAIAFAYVEELMRPGSAPQVRLADMARGAVQKTELGDGVFVVEQVYETKPRAEGFFESHRKYVDVQVIVEGEELMEVVDASRIGIDQPYLPERDLITYHDTANGSQLRLTAGEGAVFFPVDVHMPSLRIGPAAALVRKAVVKVPVA